MADDGLIATELSIFETKVPVGKKPALELIGRSRSQCRPPQTLRLWILKRAADARIENELELDRTCDTSKGSIPVKKQPVSSLFRSNTTTEAAHHTRPPFVLVLQPPGPECTVPTPPATPSVPSLKPPTRNTTPPPVHT